MLNTLLNTFTLHTFTLHEWLVTIIYIQNIFKTVIFEISDLY